MDIAQGGLTLNWAAIAGSGFVVGVLFLALVERLRRTFATREELNGLGQKFNALETLFIQVREAVDELREQILEIRAEQRFQWERINDGITTSLGRVSAKVDQMVEVHAAQRSTVEQLCKRLDRAEEYLNAEYRDGSQSQTRRRP